MPRPTRTAHHRRRRTPVGPPVPPADTPLRRPDDALRVILAAVADPPAPESVVLLLDDQHRGGVVVACRGATSAADVSLFVPMLADVAAGPSSLRASVFATSWPREGVVPRPDDESGFAAMRLELDRAGVTLLDWFLLDRDLVASVAELTGACWRWKGPEPQW